jgi:hypothetical protein
MLKPLIRVVVLVVGALSMSGCATLLQPRSEAPAPWTPAYDPPDPGDGPLYPQN